MTTSRYRSRPLTAALLLALALALALLLAACNGETPPPTATTGQGTPPTPTAQGTSSTATAGQAGSGLAQSKAALTTALQNAGFTVTADGSLQQPFLSVTGESLKVGTEFVQAFEYATETEAQQDALKIAPDATISGYRIDWIGPPHFYRSGPLLVIYPGMDRQVLAALESALGKPFAEAP
jgi:hypothetical protein